MEQTPTSAARCSGVAGSTLGNGDQPRAPQTGSHPRPQAKLPPRDLGPIARSPREGGIPGRLAPATTVSPPPPARDGAATARHRDIDEPFSETKITVVIYADFSHHITRVLRSDRSSRYSYCHVVSPRIHDRIDPFC